MSTNSILSKIRQEIERRKGYISVTHFAEELLSFLDTLSEEPDKDLEEEISRTYYDGSVTDTEDIDHVAYENIACHFAQWGAEHLADVRKMIEPPCHTVDEWIEHIQNADQLTKDIFSKGPYNVLYDALNRPYRDCYDAIKEFGELCYQTARQDMMKEAVEGEIVDSGFDDGTAILKAIVPDRRYDSGDKVKLVVIKED